MNHGAGIGFDGDVAGDGVNLRAGVGQLIAQGAQRLRAVVGDDQPRTFAREQGCGCLANAGGRTGDDGGLTGETAR
jgi:hypothetical protein